MQDSPPRNPILDMMEEEGRKYAPYERGLAVSMILLLIDLPIVELHTEWMWPCGIVALPLACIAIFCGWKVRGDGRTHLCCRLIIDEESHDPTQNVSVPLGQDREDDTRGHEESPR